jgi:Recombinase zinc beta ribbon domain
MFPNGSGGHNGRSYVYYRCPKRIAHGPDACTHRKQFRAEKVEAAAWVLVSGLLKDPARLQGALTEMIDQERSAMRADPDREAQAWLGKLNETDRKRSHYQEMAAEGLIDFDELRAKLVALDETREPAQRELETLKVRRRKLVSLVSDRNALLKRYAILVPEALEALNAEERHQLYKMLRLRVTTRNDGTLEMSGVLSEGIEFGKSEPTSLGGSRRNLHCDS